MSDQTNQPAVNAEVPPSLVFGKNASNVKTFPKTRPSDEQGATIGFTNFTDGIPDDYSTTATAGTPLKARIDDVNAIGRVASNFHYYRQCGGIVTYFPEVAAAINGYPKGAVLEYWDGSAFRWVVSLLENNLYNFVSNPAYIDGVHWGYADQWASPYCIYLDPTRQQILNVLDAGTENPGLGWEDDPSVYNIFPFAEGQDLSISLITNVRKSKWVRIEHNSFVIITARPTQSLNTDYLCYMHAGYRVKDSTGIVRRFPIVADDTGGNAEGSVYPLYGGLKINDNVTRDINVGSTCMYMAAGSFVQFVHDSDVLGINMQMTVVGLTR